MRDMRMEFKDERDMELQHGPDSQLKEVLTSIGYFSLGFSIVLFMSPIKAVILAALFSITVRIIEELGIDILGTFKKAISKLVIKPISFIGSLIMFIPVAILGLIILESFQNSMTYDNYKERMVNASEEEKIFATNSTLDEVADHKIEGGELVNLGEKVEVSDEEKDLIRENYIMNEDSGSEVKVQQLSDGSTVTKENGSQVTVWETEEEGDQA